VEGEGCWRREVFKAKARRGRRRRKTYGTYVGDGGEGSKEKLTGN
jgi:hypothetical protein